MRQRTVKNLEERLEQNSSFVIENPREAKGRWAEIFGNRNPVYLEIGCGKGQFILTRAERNPRANFIAVEGQANVILRAMEKAEAAELSNLRLFIDFVNDLNDYFEQEKFIETLYRCKCTKNRANNMLVVRRIYLS